jgi:hypothetical protein
MPQTDPDQTLHRLFETVWAQIARGVADRRHPCRHPTLATIGPHGPEARTLVLRAATRATATLELHTDAASPKAAQIAADPRVALHVWLPKPRLQIRARARATLAPGDASLFATLPPAAQANYGGAVPGTPLDIASGPDTAGDPARFTRILCALHEIDVLHLSDPHRRARFRADAAWHGAWIEP